MTLRSDAALPGGGLRLRLYVAGDSPNSALARRNLKAALAHLGSADFEIEIIDVLQQPERGLRDRIFVTPTLVRVAPAPERRIIGNLKDPRVVTSGLGLDGEDTT